METDFIGDVVMKQFVDIEIVGSFRCGRHAQPEPGFEIVEYPLVGNRSGTVYFIDDNIIKRVRREFCIYVRLGKGLDRTEEVRCIPVFLIAG